MRTRRQLYPTASPMFTCELEHCPECGSELQPVKYVNGRKTIQTLHAVLAVAYRPKVCVATACPAAGRPWPSAGWQALAPKSGTYGYEVIAQIGWERQMGRATFDQIHGQVRAHCQIALNTISQLYYHKYLPLLACHERQQWPAVRAFAAAHGLVLSLDGLMPEGGEPQLWVIRELQMGWTLRSGWLANQDEATFAAFLRPIADLNLPLRGILSDKQRGLLPAVAAVFPKVPHAFCQIHYLQNAATPVAEADEAMKLTLRKAVRAAVGDLIREKNPEHPVELTVTGLLPSPLPEPPAATVAADGPAATVAADDPAATVAADDPAATVAADDPAATIAADAQEQVVQDLLHRVRYLLTLKGRPPFKLAGQEMFARLREVKVCLDQLLRHHAEPRLRALRDGLRQALRTTRPIYRELTVAAEWLDQLAAVLKPDDRLARTGAQVQADWETCLAKIEQTGATAPRLQAFAAHIGKVSRSYAPGLFHTYDVPGLPRTNNARESEFRNVKRRLLTTTGQVGAAKRLLLRAGAWELIPTPASLAETIAAISQVESQALRQEGQRVKNHRARFRCHTRSTAQSQAQLKKLARRWKTLPAGNAPE